MWNDTPAPGSWIPAGEYKPSPKAHRILDILGHQFHWFSNCPIHRNDGSLGSTDMAKGDIFTDSEMMESLTPVVLVHEILHVLIFQGHLQFLKDDEGRDDEAKIDAVASLLVEVMRRNGMLNEDYLKRSNHESIA